MDKEKILERWRNLCCLVGLKEGSDEEWRCAKMFEEWSVFVLNLEDENVRETLAFYGYPFIRRVLDVLCMEIAIDDVVDFFTDVTIGDLISHWADSSDYELSTWQHAVLNLGTMKDVRDMVLVDFLRKYSLSAIDLEAEILSIACDYFCEGHGVKKEP